MEDVTWKVEGMTCSNCALGIRKFLEKKGLQKVNVNPLDGMVTFRSPLPVPVTELKSGITNMGYQVLEDNETVVKKKALLSSHIQRFLFCLPFTVVLMLHMLHGWVHLGWLMNPWVQLGLCLPVFIVGMMYFGKSAWQSLKSGVPNMNVLISIGALASFFYSLAGAVLGLGEGYLFFETTASIITLVFLGNYLEEVSVQKTQKAVNSLASKQKVTATMIAFDENHEELIFPVENDQLKTGDLLLINTGEQVPADCKILWGEATVSEALLTGELMPLLKGKKDLLIGGSILESGSVKAQVTAAGKDSTLSGIIRMVQQAQAEKPPMQKMADKISAIFVPVVLGIALLCFLFYYFYAGISLGASLMRAIAVLVIACPCAMGLATPAAIAVGLGRGAKAGILYRNAGALEAFKSIRHIIFDKTGTLTTGKFAIAGYHSEIDDKLFRQILFSLEKFSNHPIGKSIALNWKTKPMSWQSVKEIKGLGMRATDADGNTYEAGSAGILGDDHSDSASHSIYLIKNNIVLGWIDLEDEIRPEAAEMILSLKRKNIRISILSGDSHEKVKDIASKLGVENFLGGQSPAKKAAWVKEQNEIEPVAMVGDGINDAPALANASLGISLSQGTDLARQSADVILMSSLSSLPAALGLGKHTYLTIKQNLFWAFAYNIVAIPVAALGFLTPTLAALAMALSDVVLGANSVRLFVKKID